MNNLQVSPTYQKGYKAYWEYKTQDDNPYNLSPTLQALWREGFIDARAVDNGDVPIDVEFHSKMTEK